METHGKLYEHTRYSHRSSTEHTRDTCVLLFLSFVLFMKQGVPEVHPSGTRERASAALTHCYFSLAEPGLVTQKMEQKSTKMNDELPSPLVVSKAV